MKHLLKAVICTALAALPPLCAASAEPDYEEEMKALAVQRKTLADSGLRGFFAVAQSNRWDAPKIHSQCWVDWLPRESTERIRLEQAKRDFGLELAKAVDEEALRVLSPASTGERASQADRLLDFSGWAGRPGGYGNHHSHLPPPTSQNRSGWLKTASKAMQAVSVRSVRSPRLNVSKPQASNMSSS
jgi:hypothetical protein